MTSLSANQIASINLPLLVAVLSSILISRRLGMEVWQSILVCVATFVLCEILAWFYRSKLKTWFKSPDELCDVQFYNKRKGSTAYWDTWLGVPSINEPQVVKLCLSSPEQKTKMVQIIEIRFGAKKSYFTKL
jgi:hypothetical protein